MKYIYPILFMFFITLPAQSECLLKEGQYVNFGGSEQAITLSLEKKQAFTLQVKVWQPGKYELHERSTFIGDWSCENNILSLSQNKKTDKATISIAGKNPLGIPEKTLVIQFGSEASSIKYLNKEILYPKSVID